MVKDIIKLDRIEKRLILGLSFLLILLFILYGYFIESSVSNIVERRNTDREIGLLNASLGSLELEYVAARNIIDKERAKSLGFVEAENVSFVERADVAQRLTLRDEE